MSRGKKIIIFGLILALTLTLEPCSFASLFPEPECFCPYHSQDTGPDSVFTWCDVYEIDENLVDESVGSKSFLFGEWVHKKYWDGHWECVPFEKSWLYDYCNTFGWPKEESLTFEEISLPPQEELRSGPVRRADRDNPDILEPALIFRVKSHKTNFRKLFNDAYRSLHLQFIVRKEYYLLDYTMVLKYILELVAKGDLTKLGVPGNISMLTKLIDLNNLRTPIYFENEEKLKHFEQAYNNLKGFLDFKSEINLEKYFLAENIFLMACNFYYLIRSSQFKINSIEISALFKSMLELIPEECWRTVSVQ